MYDTKKLEKTRSDYASALAHHFAKGENYHRGLFIDSVSDGTLRPKSSRLIGSAEFLRDPKDMPISVMEGATQTFNEVADYIFWNVMFHDPTMRGVVHANDTDPNGHVRWTQKRRENGQYLEWLCKTIINDDIRFEDLYKVRDDLMLFTCAVREGYLQGDDVNINQYNAGTLAPLIMRYEAHKNPLENPDDPYTQLLKSSSVPAYVWADTDIVYNGPEGRIVIPLTWEASKFWGAGTKWCVSQRDSSYYFDDYCGATREQAKEKPLYIFLPKATEFVEETGQFQQMKYASHKRDHELRDFRDDALKDILPDAMQSLIRSWITYDRANLEDQKKMLMFLFKKTNLIPAHFSGNNIVCKILAEFNEKDWYDFLLSNESHVFDKEIIKLGRAKVIEEALLFDATLLRYVYPQTESMCLIATRNFYALMFVRDQTDKICLAAMESDVTALLYVENQTEEMCQLAIKKDGRMIKYVKNQEEDLCLMALSNNVNAFKHVKKTSRTDRIYLYAINALMNHTGEGEKEVIMQLRRQGTISVEEAGYCQKLLDKSIAQEIADFEKRALKVNQQRLSS